MSADVARLAELIVGFGANVQPGQVVAISSEPGKEELTRELAAAAYRAGAKFVDVWYFDLHVKRARLLHGAEEDLSYVPPWWGYRLERLAEMRGARIGLTGPASPDVFADVDPARAGMDQMPFLKESARIVNERTTNWCGFPCPTPGWARLVYPELEPEAALARLWEEVLHVMRMDTDDPVAAWTERIGTMEAVAARLGERRFDAIRLRGPGTDLTVGLMPSSQWRAARFETVDGIVHMPNLPTEELFTAPDPARVDGVVRATKPLWLGGSIVDGIEVAFERGRAVRIDAERNAEVLRAYAARDEGACRLGELALVDGDGRIGPLGTIFYDTLLDENAASHIALGSAYAFCVSDEADAERINHSAIHVDFMVGSPEVEVDGLTASGDAVPLLRGGAWQV
ncbi:MAG TPA: aminopeptidase [Solirubrobacteraceae bacterium]|nr:aminopeptidase [Solirubrobacteraceae bacterium]